MSSSNEEEGAFDLVSPSDEESIHSSQSAPGSEDSYGPMRSRRAHRRRRQPYRKRDRQPVEVEEPLSENEQDTRHRKYENAVRQNRQYKEQKERSAELIKFLETFDPETAIDWTEPPSIEELNCLMRDAPEGDVIRLNPNNFLPLVLDDPDVRFGMETDTVRHTVIRPYYVVNSLNQMFAISNQGSHDAFYAIQYVRQKDSKRVTWNAVTESQLRKLMKPYDVAVLERKELHVAKSQARNDRKPVPMRDSKITGYAVLQNIFDVWYNHPMRRCV